MLQIHWHAQKMQICRGSSAQVLWGRKIIQHQQSSYFPLPNHERRERWGGCEGAHQGLLILCPEHLGCGARREVPGPTPSLLAPRRKLRFQQSRAPTSLAEPMETSRARWGWAQCRGSSPNHSLLPTQGLSPRPAMLWVHCVWLPWVMGA